MLIKRSAGGQRITNIGDVFLWMGAKMRGETPEQVAAWITSGKNAQQ